MIMECIIGVGTTWHKDLFDGSIVNPPPPGTPRPVGFNSSAYRCYRGSKVLGVSLGSKGTEVRSVANLQRKSVKPGEKDEVIARYIELIEANPCNKQVMVQIGKEIGRPYQTIDNWLREAGVKRGTNVGITEDKQARIIELRKGGMSIWNIAREVHSSTHTVRRVIEECYHKNRKGAGA
jgi:hypothetical protein